MQLITALQIMEICRFNSQIVFLAMRNLFVVLLIWIALPVYAQRNPIPIQIISYNIRYNNPRDGVNAWPNRKENVKALVRFHDADIVCAQEVLDDQYEELLTMPDFAGVGVGRDDGIKKGEFSPILFNTKRFTMMDSGTFWLSKTPEMPSKGWDAALNRICTWVKLYDKLNKRNFLVFNTHFDHIGVQARIQSALLIKQKIEKIDRNLPVIFTGDLNVTPETDAIATIRTFLKDTREESEEPAYGPDGTFNDFKFESSLKERIDYIFINRYFKVQKFAVLSDSKDQRYFSDHLPVFAKIYFTLK